MNTPQVSPLSSYQIPVNLHRQIAPPKKAHVLPGKFLAALTHEVRNPLTNITLAVEMLKRLIRDDAQKLYLDIIMRGSLRINSLVNELMKYQQPEIEEVKKYSIHQLLDEVVDMAGDRLSLKNIVLKKDYAVRDFEIALDRPKMKIALTNIIVNAIEAMNPGTGVLGLVTKKINGKYVLYITDNGCGISQENLKQIFRPYFTSKPGGMGIGLAATYDILRSNHVEVNVESAEGDGTKFTLLFEKELSLQSRPPQVPAIEFEFAGLASS